MAKQYTYSRSEEIISNLNYLIGDPYFPYGERGREFIITEFSRLSDKDEFTNALKELDYPDQKGSNRKFYIVAMVQNGDEIQSIDLDLICDYFKIPRME